MVQALYTNSGEKPFELRKNDRDYKVGDVLHLQVWEPRTNSYTGREAYRRVSYVLTGAGIGCIAPLRGLMIGYAILGLIGMRETNEHDPLGRHRTGARRAPDPRSDGLSRRACVRPAVGHAV
jgi:hypothetical protein